MFPAPQPDAPETVAAVDLGSNSFHLIVARSINGQPHVLDRLREMVQLAAGLDADNQLSDAAQASAIACLERFGQRVRGMPPGTVRAVGTNALRKARNAAWFLEAAQQALGHPIEIISGQEEARLIYLGVAHDQSADQGRRLVIDIGGGSTEFIIGERFEPIQTESLYMGCVSMTLAHFANGNIRPKGFRRAVTAARLELQPIEARYRRLGWSACLGASGTIRTIHGVIRAAGWSDSGITLPALQKLRDAVLAVDHIDKLQLQGMPDDRRPLFPGGLAILIAAFEALGIERMGVADGALREGLLYDLWGRIHHEDVRARTIDALSQRYHVDTAQAARVERTANAALAQVAHAWSLDGDEPENLLSWAARLHEIGLAIAHAQYHKHGAYLAANSDMAGFSNQEQRLLATLVRGHRRKFPTGEFKNLAAAVRDHAMSLCILLRLAVLLHRGREDVELPSIVLTPGKKALNIAFPAGWLDQHPLTRADLEQEAEFLKAAKFSLTFA